MNSLSLSLSLSHTLSFSFLSLYLSSLFVGSVDESVRALEGVDMHDHTMKNVRVSGDLWGVENRDRIFEMPSKAVEMLGGEAPNLFWWWTESTHYLHRPSDSLGEFIDGQKQRMGWKHPIIGIHMRLGVDKNREAQRWVGAQGHIIHQALPPWILIKFDFQAIYAGNGTITPWFDFGFGFGYGSRFWFLVFGFWFWFWFWFGLVWFSLVPWHIQSFLQFI